MDRVHLFPAVGGRRERSSLLQACAVAADAGRRGAGARDCLRVRRGGGGQRGGGGPRRETGRPSKQTPPPPKPCPPPPTPGHPPPRRTPGPPPRAPRPP